MSTEDLMKSVPAVLLGAVYYMLPLRDWANRKHLDQVQEGLRSGLVKISGFLDNPAAFSWKALRAPFYAIVDSDATLKNKAELAYFNGLIWTTVADIRAISSVFSLISLVLHCFQVRGGLAAAILFVAVSLLSYWLSRRLTRKHMSIGEEQLEVISYRHKAQVETTIRELSNRSGS